MFAIQTQGASACYAYASPHELRTPSPLGEGVLFWNGRQVMIARTAISSTEQSPHFVENSKRCIWMINELHPRILIKGTLTAHRTEWRELESGT